MNDSLDDAIAAVRRSGREDGPALSAASRDRVVRTALKAGPAPRPFATLFVPLHRITAAAAAPVVLAGLLTFGFVQQPVHAPASAPRIQAVKSGDHVMFTIANGGTSHRVTRSLSPDRFDQSRSVRVREAYTDRIDSASSLIFYRID